MTSRTDLDALDHIPWHIEWQTTTLEMLRAPWYVSRVGVVAVWRACMLHSLLLMTPMQFFRSGTREGARTGQRLFLSLPCSTSSHLCFLFSLCTSSGMTTSGDTTSYVPPQLLNPLASETDAAEPPSLQDGVPRDLELDLRAYGAQVIHRLGQLLSLPQRVTATSQVLFQRFWYTTSFAQFSCLDVAVAAVFLSSKLEERPIPTRDLINCYDYILQRHRRLSSQSGGSSWTRNGDSKWMPPTPQNFSSSNPTRPAYQPHTHHSDTYYEFKDSLVVHEMQILKRLGFQMEALLPYAALVNYLQVLGLGRDRDVVQECWARCSDM